MNIKLSLIQGVNIIMLTLLIFVSSKISFRIPGVESVAPVTAQTLVLSLIVYLFKKWYVIMAIILFILLGILGLPMFSEGACCLETLSGNSGGYIYGFLIAAFIMKTFHEKLKSTRVSRFLYLSLFTAYVLSIGFSHLSGKIGIDLAWEYGVQPFLLGALFKVLTAFIIIELLEKYYLNSWMHVNARNYWSF